MKSPNFAKNDGRKRGGKRIIPDVIRKQDRYDMLSEMFDVSRSGVMSYFSRNGLDILISKDVLQYIVYMKCKVNG